ncbi:prostaglandin E synthase 2 [Tripterygium wilfordii]|uniref:Prostaglandin E synthase 2 n=1 Tax=Tripterygium wilfordii TaxID=458696 RepID=A0A7J7CYZ2_TRIWF|nr:prostaglandin E synthase 2 [Tripterygium wilfordii]KAF5739327.1 prostaglandin E synthase 2 [Tripterygium wilfordii]
MRGVNGVATLSRAIAGGAVAGRQQRLVQAALLSSSSAQNSPGFSRILADHLGLSSPSVARGVTGTMFFSAAAATSLAHEAHAKESPRAEIKSLPKDVVLYQYEACPFCNKVKAFLDYHNVPYKVVEVNPITKKEIKWSDYKKVPILTVDGEHMTNSSDIIDKLFQRIHPSSSIPDSDEDRKWRRWVDDNLVHVLSPNIYRTTSEALESFNYITTHGNFSFTERLVAKYAGAMAMYFVSKKLKKRHNITDEREALYEAVETWIDALEGREFLGGSRPSLADLAVFGVLRPIRHLQSGKDMVENTEIGEWFSRMEKAVGEPSRIKE